MEDNKITLRVKLAILAIVAISYYVMFFYGYEDEKSEKNLLKASNVKIAPDILFETEEYIVYKKIIRKKLTFTQGLFMDTDSTLIESGGLYGNSVLQRYNVDKPDEYMFKIDIPNQYFAEGATLLKNKIYQLTWREGKVYLSFK